MPCITEYHSETINRLDKKANWFEGVLCGVFRAISGQTGLSDLLNDVDWDEVGTTKADVMRWWKAHQEIDKQRILEDLKRAKRNKKREELKKKLNLSKEQIELLKEIIDED